MAAPAAPAPTRSAAPPIAGLDAPEPSFDDLVSAFMEDEPGEEGEKEKPPAVARGRGKEPERTEEEPEPESEQDEESVEAEEETPRKAPRKAAAQSSEEEPEGPQMLSELAAEFEGGEPAFLEAIHLPLGVDGEPVPLARIVQEYRELPQRLEQGLERGRTEIAQARAQIDHEAASRLRHLDGLVRELETLSKLEGAEPNWAELEERDPDAYAEARTRWNRRNDALTAVRKTFREESERFTQRNQEQLQEFARGQIQHLLAKRPDWRDPQKRASALKSVDRYLRSEGFADQDLEGLYDHRMVLVAWKASEYDRLAAKARGVEGKRLRRLPRVLPSGVRREEGSARSERLATKRERLRRTGSDAAAAAFLEELI